jgi:2'-5' RNA ligase
MRLFIAVNLDDQVRSYFKDKLKTLGEEIKEDLKWVDSGNLHLTLKFLGDVSSPQQPVIEEAINEAAAEWQQGLVQFRGLAAFPHTGYPKVIFVKVVEGSKLLIGIHNTLEKRLVTQGFQADDREFIPHLTIARSRRETNPKRVAQDLDKFMVEDFIDIKMKVEKISLMESKLFRSGPQYKELYSAFLK